MKHHHALAHTIVAAVLVAACGGGGDTSGAGDFTTSANACQYDSVKLAQILDPPAPFAIQDAEILRRAFPDPTAGNWRLEQPIRTLYDIRDQNNAIFMLVGGFENCFDCIAVEGASALTSDTESVKAVRVAFSYQGRKFDALAYGKMPAACGTGAAALIIPGSGLNQSTSIYSRDPSNYHAGILDALADIPYVYTFVKPNEDALAWHDGNGHKLSGDMIWNYHVNRGGSYSVSYLVQSLAFIKWMKGCFGKTVVAGLSQGGAATMLNALQSRPSVAIVASGHSLLFDEVEWAGPNQLINVPGYSRLAKANYLIDALRGSPSKWLFTWGRAETSIYKLEADTRLTANVIEPLENVDIAIHDGGHVFPVPEIKLFVAQSLNN